MIGFLHHLFIPKESNNHRAKILHHTNLLLTIASLLLATFLMQGIKVAFPSVLGIKADISSEELLSLTNNERKSAGVGSLVLNDKLSQAASRKANDMFENNYWAHNSPTGKTPWVFINSSGYKYVYAGENLARGFTSSEDVIKAWMASPSHRSNMLSSNYSDVGFAVKLGNLKGDETVLIVEYFGNPNMPIAKNTKIQEVATASDINREPIINSSSFSTNIAVVTIFMFIFVLLLDMIIIEKKKIMRFVGHNIDHIMYLLLILILVGMLSRGIII